MQDMEKWFGRWDATHLIHDASLDSSVNETFLQRQCGGSRFTHYNTHVAPNYKTIFFVERGNRTHRYMLEPIPLSSIRTIASMRRGVGAQVMRVVDYAHFALNKSKSLSIIL